MSTETLYCANHPERETLLRCNKCGKPICPECAIRHPVGLRCRECARVKKLPIYDVALAEYATAGLVGVSVSTVAAFLMSLIGGWWFVLLIIGPVVGGFIAETMSRVIGFKRGRGMQVLAGSSIVAGAVLSVLIVLFVSVPSQHWGVLLRDVRILSALFQRANWLYVIFAVIGAVTRLR